MKSNKPSSSGQKPILKDTESQHSQLKGKQSTALKAKTIIDQVGLNASLSYIQKLKSEAESKKSVKVKVNQVHGYANPQSAVKNVPSFKKTQPSTSKAPPPKQLPSSPLRNIQLPRPGALEGKKKNEVKYGNAKKFNLSNSIPLHPDITSPEGIADALFYDVESTMTSSHVSEQDSMYSFLKEEPRSEWYDDSSRAIILKSSKKNKKINEGKNPPDQILNKSETQDISLNDVPSQSQADNVSMLTSGRESEYSSRQTGTSATSNVASLSDSVTVQISSQASIGLRSEKSDGLKAGLLGMKGSNTDLGMTILTTVSNTSSSQHFVSRVPSKQLLSSSQIPVQTVVETILNPDLKDTLNNDSKNATKILLDPATNEISKKLEEKHSQLMQSQTGNLNSLGTRGPYPSTSQSGGETSRTSTSRSDYKQNSLISAGKSTTAGKKSPSTKFMDDGSTLTSRSEGHKSTTLWGNSSVLTSNNPSAPTSLSGNLLALASNSESQNSTNLWDNPATNEAGIQKSLLSRNPLPSQEEGQNSANLWDNPATNKASSQKSTGNLSIFPSQAEGKKFTNFSGNPLALTSTEESKKASSPTNPLGNQSTFWNQAESQKVTNLLDNPESNKAEIQNPITFSGNSSTLASKTETQKSFSPVNLRGNPSTLTSKPESQKSANISGPLSTPGSKVESQKSPSITNVWAHSATNKAENQQSNTTASQYPSSMSEQAKSQKYTNLSGNPLTLAGKAESQNSHSITNIYSNPAANNSENQKSNTPSVFPSKLASNVESQQSIIFRGNSPALTSKVEIQESSLRANSAKNKGNQNASALSGNLSTLPQSQKSPHKNIYPATNNAGNQKSTTSSGNPATLLEAKAGSQKSTNLWSNPSTLTGKEGSQKSPYSRNLSGKQSSASSGYTSSPKNFKSNTPSTPKSKTLNPNAYSPMNLIGNPNLQSTSKRTGQKLSFSKNSVEDPSTSTGKGGNGAGQKLSSLKAMGIGTPLKTTSLKKNLKIDSRGLNQNKKNTMQQRPWLWEVFDKMDLVQAEGGWYSEDDNYVNDSQELQDSHSHQTPKPPKSSENDASRKTPSDVK